MSHRATRVFPTPNLAAPCRRAYSSAQTAVSWLMAANNKFGAFHPSSSASASWKSPVDTRRRYRIGSSASRLRVRRAHFGRSVEVNRIRSAGSVAPRSRMRTCVTGTAPMPVWIVPARPWPCCTSRARPSAAAANPASRPKRPRPTSRQPGEQAACTGAQHLGQGILDVLGLTKPDDVDGCLRSHIALDERFWQARQPPRYAVLIPRRHPIPRIAHQT